MSLVIHCDTTRFIYEVLEQGEYDFVFRDLVIVDVGCNIGAFSLAMYDKCREIYAVDIAGDNINNLEKTIGDNGLHKIKPYCCAIAGKSGIRGIIKHGNGGGGSWGLGESSNNIQAYSLLDFLNERGIKVVDILKLDVEGSEYEILNAEDFPTDRVKTIIGEYHDKPPQDRLIQLGYRYYELPNNHFMARL